MRIVESTSVHEMRNTTDDVNEIVISTSVCVHLGVLVRNRMRNWVLDCDWHAVLQIDFLIVDYEATCHDSHLGFES